MSALFSPTRPSGRRVVAHHVQGGAAHRATLFADEPFILPPGTKNARVGLERLEPPGRLVIFEARWPGGEWEHLGAAEWFHGRILGASKDPEVADMMKFAAAEFAREVR